MTSPLTQQELRLRVNDLERAVRSITSRVDRIETPRQFTLWMDAPQSGMTKKLRLCKAKQSYTIYPHLGGITTGSFDSNGYPIFNFSTLTSQVESLIPSGYGGPVVFDFEGEWSNDLANGSADAIALGKQIIDACRDGRPNAKWGFYELPYRAVYTGEAYPESYNRTKLERIMRSKNANAQPLIQYCDAGFLVMYDLIPDVAVAQEDVDHEAWTLEASTRNALDAMAGKPLYPIVWHRQFGSITDPWAYVMQSAQELHQTAKTIMDARSGNGKWAPAGLLWWGGGTVDEYFMSLADSTPEASGVTQDFIDHIAAMRGAEYPDGYTTAKLLEVHKQVLTVLSEACKLTLGSSEIDRYVGEAVVV